MKSEFLLDRYNRELERGNKITGSVSFPVTMLIALGGVLVAMARSLPAHANEYLLGFFVMAEGLTIAPLVASLFCLSKAFVSQKYEYLPGLQQLTDEESANPTTFQADFEQAIIDAADVNTDANDARETYLEIGNRALVFGVIGTAVSGGLYVWIYLVKT